MARILVADDEPAVLNSLSTLLRSLNHDVTSVSDSEKAARLVCEENYDMLVTDIHMSPIDGMQLLQLAHEAHPDMPAIVVSAFTSDATQQRGYDLGCKAYIKKPFNIEDVIEAVEQALAG